MRVKVGSRRRHSEGQGWILLLAVSILIVICVGWINGDPLPPKVHARLPYPNAAPRDRHRLMSGPSSAELARQGPSRSDLWQRFYHPPSEKPRPPWDAFIWQSNAWQKVIVINSDGLNYQVRYSTNQPGRADEWIREGYIAFGDEPPDPIETLVEAEVMVALELPPIYGATGRLYTTTTNIPLADPAGQSFDRIPFEGFLSLKPGPGPSGTPAPVIHGSPKRGDLMVYRDDAWWPTTILQRTGNRMLVRYASHRGASDEWVTVYDVSMYAGDGKEPAP